MPYRVDWVLLCDRLERDPSTGKFSVFGLWEYQSAPAFPTTTLFAVLARIRKVEGKQGKDSGGKVYMRLTSPVASGGDFGTDVAPGTRLTIAETEEAVVTLNPFVGAYYYPAEFNVNLPVPGEYQLEVYINDVLAHVQTFEVIPLGN